jgi:uncharacterized protein (DUF1697 family)
MSDLRDLAATLGLADAKTLLQSGNVVFSAKHRTGSSLELLFERGAEKHLGLSTDFFVRSAAEWNDIVSGNPFAREATDDPGHLILLTMKRAPAAAAISLLEGAIKGRETIRAAGSHAYVTYPDGVGQSKLTIRLIERKLGTAVTGRNWNTVLRIHALLD